MTHCTLLSGPARAVVELGFAAELAAELAAGLADELAAGLASKEVVVVVE
jgi:hypothetical protein